MWKRLVALLVALSVTVLSAPPASSAIPKVGAGCNNLASKYKTLVCTKVRGKLQWQIAKSPQSISFSAPIKASVRDKTLKFIAKSSSGLRVNGQSLTQNICSSSGAEIQLLGTAGICRLKLTQAGNSIYLAAASKTIQIKVFGINAISFQLPGALLLSQQTYEIAASSGSNLPVVLTTESPNICTISGLTLLLLSLGKCTITANQVGAKFFLAAAPISQTVEISTSRVTADLPDAVTGFQVKAIYVVPSDGADNSYDINGVIVNVLKAGNRYVEEELGLTFPIDSTATGYDIAFIRSSKPSSYFLNTSGSYAELIRESKFLESPGANRKNYIFFVDTETVVGSAYCGQAPRPGIAAVVAIGKNECGNQSLFFENFASQTWIHELIHNLGVAHVLDSCDLMTSGQAEDGPSCPVNQRLSIDRLRKQYVQGSEFGTDITKLRVWSGFTSDKKLIANCFVTPTNEVSPSDGLQFAYCPTGKQIIGPAQFCWMFIDDTSLEELVNGNWLSVGVGTGQYQPWGSAVDWKCGSPAYRAPSIELTVNTPGSRRYRWIVNGKVAEEMKIFWMQ